MTDYRFEHFWHEKIPNLYAILPKLRAEAEKIVTKSSAGNEEISEEIEEMRRIRSEEFSQIDDVIFTDRNARDSSKEGTWTYHFNLAVNHFVNTAQFVSLKEYCQELYDDGIKECEILVEQIQKKSGSKLYDLKTFWDERILELYKLLDEIREQAEKIVDKLAKEDGDIDAESNKLQEKRRKFVSAHNRIFLGDTNTLVEGTWTEVFNNAVNNFTDVIQYAGIPGSSKESYDGALDFCEVLVAHIKKHT